ncbi:uncharacterized protein LOC141592215 [Silene latifolia]|uniref:uncharacterized protein LOC141592215 n=1 Tax=Silene latifolia TaxID=37657 RepID=UPI003D777DA9
MFNRLSACNFFLICLLLSSFPGNVAAAVVTLHNIYLYDTLDLIGDPTVYFKCKGENKTVLPDVKQAGVLYTFTRKESWQPLTNFSSGKCKRCGLYEKDNFPWPSSDVFYEWNLCPPSFKSPDGLYFFVRERRFFATFSCPPCPHLDAVPYDDGPELRRLRVEVGIGLLIIIVVVISVIVRFKIREKKKGGSNETRSSEP